MSAWSTRVHRNTLQLALIRMRPIAVSLVCLFAFLTPASHANSSRAEQAAQEKRKEQVDWNLLKFDDKRRITRLRLIFKNYNEFNGRRDRTVREIVSEDPLLLLLATDGFQDALRHTPQSSEFISGALPYGELQVDTSDGSFFVALRHGFALNSHTEMLSNRFFSWPLAKVVETLSSKDGGTTLTQKQFDRLSGADWVNILIKRYEADLKKVDK